MRKSVVTAGLAALVLAGAGAATSVGTASAATPKPWRVTYVSAETGYDDFGLFDVAATGANDAWAVGATQQGGGGAGALLRWNGSGWAGITIPGDNGSYNTVDASGKNNVWVTGATNQAASESWHWNGTSWTTVSLDGYSAADVAVVGAKNAWAVGNADEGSDVGEARHWNGTAWKKVAMPFVARRISGVAANDIWAVGENADQPLAAHWNGTAWTSVTLPEVPIPAGQNGFSYFNDIVSLASDNVWAVGRLYWGSGGEELAGKAKHTDRAAADSEHNRPVLMHWNGHKWSLTLGPESDFAMSVAADGNGGIWYSTFNKNYVHVATDGTTTTVPVPTPVGRNQAPEIRKITGVPGGVKVLGVGEVAPELGGDQSWDAVVEQYG